MLKTLTKVVVVIYLAHLRDVDYYYDQWSNCSTNELESTTTTSKRSRAMTRIQQSLIAAQELGDEKLEVVGQLQEMIDLKTRQLDADYKNLEYADKDDPALRDTPPKETQPSSPASYSLSTNSNVRCDVSLAMDVPNTSSLPNHERSSANNNSLNSIGNVNLSSTHSGDRSWKRSRRARETVARSGNNSNNFSNIPKTSQIDLDSNNSNSNHSKSNASTSGQQSNIQSTSNVNRKQSGSNGGNNSNKKRKRKSGRSNNGSNGSFSILFIHFYSI